MYISQKTYDRIRSELGICKCDAKKIASIYFRSIMDIASGFDVDDIQCPGDVNDKGYYIPIKRIGTVKLSFGRIRKFRERNYGKQENG